MKKKLLAALLSLAVFIQCESLPVFAESNRGSFQHSNDVVEQIYDCSSKPLYLLCRNEDTKEYKHGAIIRKQFEIKSNQEIDTFEISLSSYDGVEIIKAPTYSIDNKDGRFIEIEFKVLDLCEIGNICFTVNCCSSIDKESTGNISYEQKIYCYHDLDNDYVSTISLDCLSDYSDKLQNYILDINRQGEVIQNERHDIGSLFSLNSNEEYTLSVSGYISWTDINYGVHAAEDVTVELYSVNGLTESLVGTASTNSVGGYSISFSSPNINQNVKLKVLSENDCISVRKETNVNETYSYISSTFEVWGFARASYTAPNNTAEGEALSIHQAMNMASRYVNDIDSLCPRNVSVVYPYSYGVSKYNSNQNKIYIMQEDNFDWDVCQHEYGHYIQYHCNIENNPGGQHTIDTNMADTYMTDDKPENDAIAKNLGIELAWAEGWATYFAINLQKEESASSLGIPYVGDGVYSDMYYISNNLYSHVYFNVETPPNWQLGEANEAAVCAILYDITDGINTSEEDYIYISSSNIWNIIKTNHCKTLSEFVSAFYSAGYSPYTKYSLGSTLSRYKVAASLNTTSVTSNISPTFSWNAQGGSTYFPNNRFRLVILDINYNHIYSSGPLYYASNYQIPSSTWNNIRNNYSMVYYYVESYQTNQVTTGPYYSTIKTLYTS